MKKKKMLVRAVCVLFALLMYLTACTGCSGPTGGGAGDGTPSVSQTPSPQPNEGKTETYPVPLENRRSQVGPCPSSVVDGYYAVGNVVRFREATGGPMVTLCAQPGCEHKDEVCHAWIGDVKYFTEYHGDIYAVRGDYDVDFVRKDLSDGSITVLAEWKSSDTVYYRASIGSISDGYATLHLVTSVRKGVDFPDVEDEYSTWMINIENGEKEQFVQGNGAGVVLAHSKNYVLFYRDDLERSHLLSREEFAQQYGEGLSWASYLGRETFRELYLYDRTTGETTLITDKEKGYYPTSDPNYCYGKEVVYVEGDGVFLLNLDNGESRKLLETKGVINYWIMDHKVFLITQEGNLLDPSEPIKLWYADMIDGQLVQMGNAGNTEYMVFAMMAEGESFFTDGMYSFLSKADFYAENYDNISY